MTGKAKPVYALEHKHRRPGDKACCVMERADAIQLLEEALARIRAPRANANGGNEQVGGAYWRLAKVLSQYLDPKLEQEEGHEHAEFIRAMHGQLLKLNTEGKRA